MSAVLAYCYTTGPVILPRDCPFQHRLSGERFAAGADSGSEMLQSSGEKTGVVVHGSIELTVGFQVYELQAGDGFCFDSSRPHRFRNTGDTECELCVVNVPLPAKLHQPGMS